MAITSLTNRDNSVQSVRSVYDPGEVWAAARLLFSRHPPTALYSLLC